MDFSHKRGNNNRWLEIMSTIVVNVLEYNLSLILGI